MNKKLLIVALVLVFAFSTFPASHAVAAEPRALTCGDATFNATFESQLIQLINQKRAKKGIAKLTANSMLTVAALRHSQDMACNDFFNHVGSDASVFTVRFLDAGYSYSRAGENIAAGYSTPAAVLSAWMGSSGHKANILNPKFKNIGIGYVFRAASTYDHYWTADFGKP